MEKRLLGAGGGLYAGLLRAGVLLAAAGVARGTFPPLLAQDNLVNAPEPSRVTRERALPDQLPGKPSQSPAFTIPVAPLGFAAPGAFYLGQRISVASLDFLDENRLLFTFRVPGLIRREAGENNQRRICAVVLRLPAGTVEAEAMWTVHDQARYLWMLKDGHFLLRDGENLELGDATLELKPYLHFPGALVWLEMDPTQQFLVTDSRESAAAPSMELDGQNPAGDTGLAVRILRRDSGKVMLVSRVSSVPHLPINADGYLQSQRASGNAWLLNLTYFSGGSAILGQVDSTCSPLFDFLSQREVLVTACTASGAGRLVAMGTNGRHLWEEQTSDATVWPLVVRAPDGLRLVREALAVAYPVNAHSTLDQEEIKGQLVQVLDAADGKVALAAAASPVLDAGGNVAISPSGRRVALLSGGAIQIFELPPPPPLPEFAVPGVPR
jgi:hypothetical protein